MPRHGQRNMLHLHLHLHLILLLHLHLLLLLLAHRSSHGPPGEAHGDEVPRAAAGGPPRHRRRRALLPRRVVLDRRRRRTAVAAAVAVEIVEGVDAQRPAGESRGASHHRRRRGVGV